MKIKFILLSFISYFFLLRSGFCQSQFFVSLKGNDRNPGTKEKPFASIAKSQSEARKKKGSITVYIREGIYYLKESVVFLPEDSRQGHEKITFKTYANEKVILSGGTPLSLQWKDYKDGLKQAYVAENLVFDQLFVNGQLQRMARYPNYNPTSKVFGGTSKDAISADRIKTWKNPEGGYVHALHPSEWGSYHFLIREKNELYPGPKTNNYPANCMVYDNLMHDLEIFEKQVAGVHISMAQDIKVSHNNIYNVPRAGINANDGMWGGHLIEFNEVFNTVLETSDNGAFNSWGRDRNWVGQRGLDSILESHRDKVALLDNVKPTAIRNNRFQCDSGWDIDLDDGSTNYIIYNNILLNGGLKFREGFFRSAENNIIINNSFHPHVWFKTVMIFSGET